MKRLCKKSTTFLFLLMSILLSTSTALAGELVLHAPEQSSDGSYILHLEIADGKHFDSLELYRNINDSEYKLLVTVPFFKAISQMVSQNGRYGYKIRGVASDGSSEFSEPVFVSVKSKSIELKTHAREMLEEKRQVELTLGAR